MIIICPHLINALGVSEFCNKLVSIQRRAAASVTDRRGDAEKGFSGFDWGGTPLQLFDNHLFMPLVSQNLQVKLPLEQKETEAEYHDITLVEMGKPLFFSIVVKQDLCRYSNAG